MSFAYRHGVTGLVVGKLCPPHSGHHYLIESAMNYADQVWVLVVDSYVEGFTMTAEQRLECLSEIHPGAIIRIMPDIRVDDNSEYWAEYTKAFLGFTPDIVFTSEDYGNPWSQALGCRHIMVDYPRNLHQISGTMVRENPVAYLDQLKPPVRALMVERVSVLGAESTGTTTLANALGEHYHTNVVPEFGRLRDEAKVARDGAPYDWPTEDFFYTARVQQAMENEAARTAHPVLICDTDPLATHLWHERYLGELSGDVNRCVTNNYALTIVTSPDGIEPEEDGLRFEMHKRQQMHQAFIEDLEMRGRPYIVVTGTPEERLAQATEAIDRILKKEKVAT